MGFWDPVLLRELLALGSTTSGNKDLSADVLCNNNSSLSKISI